MSLTSWREKMKRFEKNAKVIFDREEPVGKATDMVLPDRRWFRRKSARVMAASRTVNFNAK